MLPQLHSSSNASVKPSDLNLHLTFAWYKDAPLLADDFYRACIGTDLNWQALTIYWHVRNDFGRKRIRDTFGFEWGGSAEEEAINASIHVQSLATLRELPGDEAFWASFALVWDRWEVAVKARQDKPAPKPPEPKPQPPLPKPPAPKPPLPKPPAPKPPLPKPPAPTPTPTPAPAKNWLKGIATAVTVVAGLVSVASFFVPALAPVNAVLKLLVQLFAQLGGG